jgi:hypothetical protein
MFQGKNRKFFFIVALTMALLLGLTSIAMAAVWTDQPDYVPGSVVTISGGNDESGAPGYWPEAVVNVAITGPHDPAFESTTCQNVPVAENGSWSCTVTLWGDLGWSVGTYEYTATSMNEAGDPILEVETFTDSNPNASITVTASPAGAVGGTFSITRVQRNEGTQTSGGTTIQTFGGLIPSTSFSITNIQSPVNGCNYVGSATVTGTTGAADTTTTVTLQYTCGKAPGSVSINNIPVSAVYGGSFTPTFTKLGDGTPSVASLTTSTCTVAAGVVSYVGVGTCTLQASITEGTDYLAATGDPQSFTIGKAPGSVSINNIPVSATYGGSFTPTFTKLGDGATSVVSNSTVVCTVTAGVVSFISTGTCELQASVAEGTNYLGATGVEQSFTIDKATLTVTADDQTITYGDTEPTFTLKYSGFQFSDNASVLDTKPTCGVAGDHKDAGTYTIACSGGADNNYDFKYVDGALTIEKATLTVTADNKEIYFGNPDPTFTFLYSGFKYMDDASVIDVAPTCGVDVAHTAVGSYDIVCSGGSDNNYDFSFVKGTLTVNAWDLYGFYHPVDMNGVFNTVKGGSTVPLKFEIFAGSTELTDTAYIKSFSSVSVSCTIAATDAIEITATGGTSLRYDPIAGQFIFNWQTPKTPGACYKVTMTTQDGSSLEAYFKLK